MDLVLVLIMVYPFALNPATFSPGLRQKQQPQNLVTIPNNNGTLQYVSVALTYDEGAL
jgi:hypothetical protein